MSVVMEVIHVTDRGMLERGHYLEWADIEAFDGRGDARVTRDLAKAMRFDDLTTAFEYWRATSKTRPIRDDGRPNRPLTAFSITFREVDSDGVLKGVGVAPSMSD